MCRLHASPSEPRWRSSPLCLAWTTRNAKKLKKEKGHHHLAWTTRNIYKSHGKKKKKQQSWWKNKSFSKILAFAECWMLQHWLCSIPEKKILKKGKAGAEKNSQWWCVEILKRCHKGNKNFQAKPTRPWWGWIIESWSSWEWKQKWIFQLFHLNLTWYLAKRLPSEPSSISRTTCPPTAAPLKNI